jgi:3-oxoacyl-[acyl-carrier protein] reductase
MGDCGTAEGCNQIAGTGISRFGAIDVLIHNAAIRPASPFLEMDEGCACPAWSGRVGGGLSTSPG